MNARFHARLARQLIQACGGLEESSDAIGRRLKKSRLAQFQDPGSGYAMPADLIADLEAHCGQPIYSRALFEAVPGHETAAELAGEAFATTEVAASLQALIRSLRGRPLGEAARRQALADCAQLDGHIRAIVGNLDGEGGA